MKPTILLAFAGLRAFAASFGLTLWIAAPVWGDDTEIFFGNFNGGDFQPNVLFIMDTSGSMRSRPNDTTSDAKINIVKEALRTLAGEMSGVNVGLMRFSNPGGPVLYPVTAIDKEIPPFGTGSETVVSIMASSQSDATEKIETGVVDTGSASSSVGVGADVVTIEAFVGGDDEDAEESAGGNYSRFSDDFDLKGVGAYAGIRFFEIDVPRGASIVDARLSMTLNNDSSDNRGSLTTRVCGDLVPAPDFRDTFSSRPSQRDLTAACVNWQMDNPPGTAPPVNSVITSPNLAAIIQEITSDPDWRNGNWANNDVVLILEQTAASDSGAERELRTYDNSPSASTLVITYAEGTGGSSTHIAGLQFEGVAIPQGASITAAYLELTPRNSVASAQDVSVAIESGAAATPFIGTNSELSSRLAATDLSASIPIASWNDGVTVQMDVTGLVQSVVTSGSWCGGEPLGFVLSKLGDRLDFESYDGDPNLAPQLRITYDADSVTPGATCVEAGQTKRIATSNDDIEFRNASGSDYVSSRDYIYINDDEWITMRFSDYTLPADAEVTSAYLYLVADRDDTTTDVTLKLSIEQVADSLPLPGNNPGSRNWSGDVRWNITENWRNQQSYRSPDISSLINRVLTAGFSAGNAITVRADLVAGDRLTWETFEANPILSPMLEVNFKSTGSESFNTARTEFITAVDSLSAEGFTPIQDTLFEAYQYYAGDDVIWGKYRGGHDPDGRRINVANESADAEPFWYTRVSVEDSITTDSWGGVVRPPGCTADNLSSKACDDPNGAGEPEGEYLAGNPVYKTPIASECQFESHIVFLTDGAANEPHSRELIQSAIGTTSCPSSSNSSQACVVELADYMYNNDMNDTLEGDQRVRTHMVGFDYDEPWLESIAAAGGGTYATANDLDSLLTQFKTIIAEVLKTDTSFVAPVAAINQFNRLTNRDEVYFAVFKPEGVPAWPGNLKRYRLGSANGQTNVLLDANDNPAVDPDTGFFETSARSFWSSVTDGADVEKGGAAGNLPSYLLRKVFTDLTSAPTTLTADGNLLSGANSALTDAVLQVSASERDDLIDWIRGKDVDDEDGDGTTAEDRLAIGDPLHSRPVAVNYGAGDNATSEVVLFFGTNAGNVHAINADTGVELFTYIPQELLSLQADLRRNSGSNSHYYGMDGSPSAWVKNNGSATISEAEGDHVYLYIGQRRGGLNYYALDVTDVAAPRLLWKITGGTGDFAELGYTWARPVVGRLNIGGTPTDVVYLAGGYDEANDDEMTRNETADVRGNVLYIVNATDGSLLWSGGMSEGHTLVLPELMHSLPAAPAVFDVDSDGFDDGMFLGDTGGQVWRFDFQQGQSITNLVRGGVIAKLGNNGATDAASNRRFYHTPDVALADINGVTKLVVTIGSGARPSPLSETVNDRFYAIFQNSVFAAPTSYEVLYEGDDPATAGIIETSDFYDATANLLQTATGTEAEVEAAALAAASGWYMDFPRAGEKVLSTPLSFRGGVSFTTYEPKNEANSCTPKAGTSRLYLVNLADGTVPDEQLGVTPPLVPETPERAIVLNTPSIIEEPVIICTGDGCELFAGPEQPPLPLLEGSNIVRTHWRQD